MQKCPRVEKELKSAIKIGKSRVPEGCYFNSWRIQLLHSPNIKTTCYRDRKRALSFLT